MMKIKFHVFHGNGTLSFLYIKWNCHLLTSFQAFIQFLIAQMTFNKLTEPSLTEREPYALASELRFEC